MNRALRFTLLGLAVVVVRRLVREPLPCSRPLLGVDLDRLHLP
jgi:hypothetical protein